MDNFHNYADELLSPPKNINQWDARIRRDYPQYNQHEQETIESKNNDLQSPPPNWISVHSWCFESYHLKDNEKVRICTKQVKRYELPV